MSHSAEMKRTGRSLTFHYRLSSVTQPILEALVANVFLFFSFLFFFFFFSCRRELCDTEVCFLVAL